MERFVLDACSIYVGTITTPEDLSSLENQLLGLTNGGVTVTAVPIVRQIEFDGKKERRIKDMNRILGWNCGVETKGLELNEASLTLSLLEKDETYSGTKYDRFNPSNKVSYKDLIVVGQLHQSSPIIIVLKDCFNEDGFSLETSDSKEGTYSLKAYSNYTYNPIKDAAGTAKIPMEIYLPKEDGVALTSIENLSEQQSEISSEKNV